VIFQAGGLDQLGELVAEYGGRRALIVTDAGIVAAGHVARAVESLRARDVDVVIFDQVKENPTDTVVSDCATLAKDAQVDFLVGLGGGSSMDTAKGCNFVVTNGGAIAEYWGVGKATQPMLPLIAVPTTTGTGSECQSFALISDSATHVKMACGDPKAAARVALLDPVLTQSQPRTVKICTGIDAISHAVESAVCNRRSSMSDIFSHGAFEYCASSFPGVVAETRDLVALGRMQIGAAWAGSAIELSMLGAAHAMANPLTKRFGLIHGLAVGLMLPTVVRFNAADTKSEAVYRALLLRAGLPTHAPTQSSAGEALADWLEQTFDQSGLQDLLGPLLIPEK
jgi:alcohol dehydrogenase